MPSLLTIPREIRDQIYGWALSDTLASSQAPDLHRERKRIHYSSSNPETYFGEDAVRYQTHTSLPPTHALLHTARQLRYECLDSIKRLGQLRYKVDLVDRGDMGVLVPTWTSVPLFTDRIDVLEVQWRCRYNRTSSIITDVEDTKWCLEGCRFSASLAMLQRFIERGVHLLSKKKARKVHIGLLAVHIIPEADVSAEILAVDAEEKCRVLEEWMLDGTPMSYGEAAEQREDAQFRLLARKIDRLEIFANKKLAREWELSEVVAKRDERARNNAQNRNVEE